jgi:hypothetical protein
LNNDCDTNTPCPLHEVNLAFKAEHPNQLWVSDFTYVSSLQGRLFLTFVINVSAQHTQAGAQVENARGLRTGCTGEDKLRAVI